MADTPTLPTVTVTGDVPIFGDPFAADSQGLTDYLGGQSLNEYAASMEAANPGAAQEPTESFAPPVVPLPVKLLPEVVVEAPTIFGSILTGLTALLFPQPMGPREFDEAPGGGGAPPPPGTPVGEDPIMPPNWWDLIEEPFPVDKPGPPLVPIPMTKVPPVEMPPGEEFVDVSPPRPTTRAQPGFPVDQFWLTPINPIIELPYATPDYGVDPGPGPAPAPTITPRSDPVPGIPDLLPDFWPSVGPQPASPPAPDVSSPPLPDVIANPFGDPFAAPPLPAPPRGNPDPTTGPGDPFAFPDAQIDPLLTEFGPSPLKPQADTCQCDKKKPKKKKSKPRDVCYRGTYRQNSRGITYKRLEEIPCEPKKAVSKRETDAFGRPVPKKNSKRSTPTWQDTLDQVFGRFQP